MASKTAAERLWRYCEENSCQDGPTSSDLAEAMCKALEEAAKLSCNACVVNVEHETHSREYGRIRSLLAELRKEDK